MRILSLCKLLVSSCSAVLSFTHATCAVANESAAPLKYGPDYFAASEPVTALDMAERVPGFVLVAGEDGRGLSGTEPNVLIDGRRPVSRSETIAEMLRRIPASQVAYLELMAVPPPGISMENHVVLLNVVRNRTAAAWLAVTAEATIADHRLQPKLTADFGGTHGTSSIDGSLSLYRSTGNANVRRYTEYDSASRVTYDVDLKNRYRENGGSVSSRAESRTSGDIRIAVNGSYTKSSSHSEVESRQRQASIVSPGWVDVSDEHSWSTEFGGEVEAAVAPGTSVRMNLVRTSSRDRSDESYSDIFYEALSESDARTNETILRLIATHRPNSTLELEAGAEGAFNDVRQFFALTLDGSKVAIPGDYTDITEVRGEFHAGLRWTPIATFSVDAALRWEVSRLKVSEPAVSRVRTFFFGKPRLDLTYLPQKQTSIRLRIERAVRQLDFPDFVASGSLDTFIIDAGNPDLSPETNWSFELWGERRFGTKGSVSVAIGHALISDALDYLPLREDFDSIGNIGKAHRWTFRTELSLPLDGVGLRDGLVRAEITRRISRVTDPVTGGERPLSREYPWEGTIRFSHDLATLPTSWGIDYTISKVSRHFRGAEEVIEREAGTIGAWAEYKPSSKWVLRAEIHAGDREAVTRRIVLAGERSKSTVLGTELDRTEPAVVFNLSARLAI